MSPNMLSRVVVIAGVALVAAVGVANAPAAEVEMAVLRVVERSVPLGNAERVNLADIDKDGCVVDDVKESRSSVVAVAGRSGDSPQRASAAVVSRNVIEGPAA